MLSTLEAEHPVVRTDPEAGRKALYVNPGHAVRFAGWSVMHRTALAGDAPR